MTNEAPHVVADDTTVKTANENKSPKDIHEMQNNLANAISGATQSKLKEVQNALPIRIVKPGDSLGAIVKGLNGGKLNWGMEVVYRSSRLPEDKKPKILAKAGRIYPKQKVWMEGGKIVVADEMPGEKLKEGNADLTVRVEPAVKIGSSESPSKLNIAPTNFPPKEGGITPATVIKGAPLSKVDDNQNSGGGIQKATVIKSE